MRTARKAACRRVALPKKEKDYVRGFGSFPSRGNPEMNARTLSKGTCAIATINKEYAKERILEYKEESDRAKLIIPADSETGRSLRP